VTSGEWLEPTVRVRSHFDDGTCEFLGVRHALQSAGWDAPFIGKLWRYNLHYFDDLLSGDSGQRLEGQAQLLDRWIAENPPARGTGWEPYPTALRIVNWCKWILRYGSPSDAHAHSLAVQVRWLERRLEYHLLGNHLWVNGKALVFAGAFFIGPESDRWLRQGLRILRRELGEQVLADGAHFERSPMYHALFVEDLLDLCNLAKAYAGRIPDEDTRGWATAALRMLAWLQAVSHGDLLAHFNDVAQGIAPIPSSLLDYADRLCLGPPAEWPSAGVMLAGAGLVRLEAGTAALIADVAPIGPDYMPGHGHADTLSFELSLGGHRVFVNEGTSTYDPGPERLRQRGTAAHNTVVVDEADSSEVWSSFRVARRARIIESLLGGDGRSLVLAGAHDGYRRLRGKVTHRRSWRLEADQLEISDELHGRFDSAEARMLIAPGWEANVHGAAVRLVGPGGTVTCRADSGVLRLEPAEYHAGFGSVTPTRRICVRLPDGQLRVCIEWEI